MKKKVLFVAGHFGMGGLEKVNVYLANHLAEFKDVEVCFFSKKKNTEVFYDLKGMHSSYEAKKSLTTNMLRFFDKVCAWSEMKLNQGSYNYIKYHKKMIYQLVAFAKEQKVDTIIVNARDGAAMLPLIKKELPNVNCIAWMHNNHLVYLTKKYHTAKCDYLESFFEGLEVADSVVCLTREDVPYFEKYNINTLCINNPLTMTMSGRANLSSKNISYVGRIQFVSKGLDYLAELAKYLPNPWKIMFAGKGSKNNEKQFKEAINNNSVQDKICLLGSKKDEGLKKVFENSSVYIMTSRWEGMPLVLAEAMSFGLPIIAFDQVGSKEVLDYGKYGILVEQGNTRKMAEELNKLIESKELREHYSKLSLERVKDFDINKISEQWLEIL